MIPLLLTVSILLFCHYRYIDPEFNSRIGLFEKKMELLRQGLKIPAMSIAIAKNGKIVYTKGLGFADMENQIPATKHTTYRIASLTKTFSSTLILQLVDEGLIHLDDPVEKYGIFIKSSGIVRIRHLLSHTSEGEFPGEFYHYSGNFRHLATIAQVATGKSFMQLLIERIIKPARLKNTMPCKIDTILCEQYGIDYPEIVGNLAKPYLLDSLANLTNGSYPNYFGASAGLVSSVTDMARYAVLMDNYKFLKKETRRLTYIPAISIHGDTLPYSMGWFVNWFNGQKIVWHYGFWDCNSSMFIRIPEKKLSLIILTNTDKLSEPFPELENGNIFASPVAVEFCKLFLSDFKDINCTIPVQFFNSNYYFKLLPNNQFQHEKATNSRTSETEHSPDE